VKSFVKTGFENLKSMIPTKTQDNKEKLDDIDSRRRGSSELTDSAPNRAESPTLMDQVKSKFKRSSSPPSNTIEKEKHSSPYEPLWQTSSQQKGRR
jgi:hypothetical protein